MEQAHVRKVGDYIIRQCTVQDLPKVVEINLVTLPEHYSDYFFEELLRESPETFLVTEKDGELVGYVLCRIEFGFSNTKLLRPVRKGHLVSVAVMKAHQRKGLGRALTEASAEVMRKKNCAEVYLEVRVSNHPAISLYEKIGFTKSSRLENYYRDGEAAYLMVMPL